MIVEKLKQLSHLASIKFTYCGCRKLKPAVTLFLQSKVCSMHFFFGGGGRVKTKDLDCSNFSFLFSRKKKRGCNDFV